MLLTGLALSGLWLASAAAAANGQRISVAEYDRDDGSSPGSAMILDVPGLDNPKALARTGAVGLLNLKRAFAKHQPIVVIDESTGRRQLIYVQLDANAGVPEATDLMILPGREFTEGHTYVVAMRNLRNSSGHLLKAPAWFAKLRDNRRSHLALRPRPAPRALGGDRQLGPDLGRQPQHGLLRHRLVELAAGDTGFDATAVASLACSRRWSTGFSRAC